MKVDVIILSNTADIGYYNMLKKCITSIKNSEKVETQIIVVETNKNLKGKKDKLKLPIDKFIVPDDKKFNFNKYQNYGLEQCDNNYICFSNNDVFYEKDTLYKLVKHLDKYDSVSPWERKISYLFFKQPGIYEGYSSRQHITGWCIVTKRQTLEKIGKFDERFSFWFADDDYSKMLQINNLKHALIGEAVVDHLAEQSHKLWGPGERYEQTDGLGKVFEDKWGKTKL